MTPLFLYLLKVNIALLLFYLAYRYGLRRLTFYTLNRFFLLFAIAFSSLYPLIDINGLLRDHSAAGGEIIYYLPDLGGLAQESSLGVWNILTVVFWSGVSLMAARFLVQFISLVRIHFTSEKRETSRQTVRIVTEKINPFSFFRNIYINPQLHSPEEQGSILQHEQVHVKEWHTADILAGELNRIFYWFNPGAWLMMTAIRENLEFITDRKVLQNGIDAKAYQYSLVKVSKIPYASSLANNFNFSHLKIRISMMDKKPSSELHLIKYLVLVPFVAAISLAFNIRAAQPEIQQTSYSPPLADTIPARSQIVIFDGEADNGVALSDTIPILPAQEVTMKGTADSIRKSFPAYRSENKNTDLPFLRRKDDKTEGVHYIAISKEGVTSNISSNSASQIVLENNKIMILIDGKESDYETARKLSRKEIDTYMAISGNAALKKYGSKGEYGVIKITTKH